jgi:hypothetical protein
MTVCDPARSSCVADGPWVRGGHRPCERLAPVWSSTRDEVIVGSHLADVVIWRTELRTPPEPAGPITSPVPWCHAIRPPLLADRTHVGAPPPPSGPGDLRCVLRVFGRIDLRANEPHVMDMVGRDIGGEASRPRWIGRDRWRLTGSKLATFGPIGLNTRRPTARVEPRPGSRRGRPRGRGDPR